MKKVLLTAFAVMASLSLYAQGTLVFKNDANSLIKLDNGTSIVNAPATAYSVGLWWAPVGTTDPTAFQFVTGSTKALGPVAGRFDGGAKTVAGIAPGAIVAIQVRGWDSSAASYDAAYGVKATGMSSIFTVDCGDPTTVPPGTAGAMLPQFTGFTMSVVPEPSTIALGMLGLAGLFLLRRRS